MYYSAVFESKKEIPVTVISSLSGRRHNVGSRRLLLLIVGVVFLGFLTLLLWWYVHPTTPAERKDFVQLMTQLLGGTVLLISLFFTWRNMQIAQETTSNNQKNAQENLRISQEGHITDRFSKAIDQLGNRESLAVRIGGIYALERIARDSKRDHWPIMEILTAFVRQSTKWKDESDQEPEEDWPETPADIQAILTVLARRTRTYNKGEDQPLVLDSTDLRNTHLEQAHLEGAILWSAHLDGAVLCQARLEESRLTTASLAGANLTEAHLEGATLSVTVMDHAILSGAFFNGATVDRVSLEGADLTGAHLEGVDLSTATGLTWEQVRKAHMDDGTKLPPRLEKSRQAR
jgi:hypothetical protein